VVAAISGRALATAARRAGYRPLVADLFCDSDTVALSERTMQLSGDLHHGIDAERAVAALKELAAGERPVAVVCGSGFERKPDLVDEIARHFVLAGNSGETIRRIKDPHVLATYCAQLGIPHPEVRPDLPPDPDNWLVKAAGGAGGSHIQRANGAAPRAGLYYQRFVHGTSISALFVGDGRQARVVGYSRQWAAPAPAVPYRYGGAVRLVRFDRRQAAMIGDWLCGLTQRAGLVGLCSADFIRSGSSLQLVEINPRPGATLDIFDSDEAPLMEAHLRAAKGEAFRLPRFVDSMAAMIAYTHRPVPVFPAVCWPEWSADRQSAGTRLAASDPVCTVFARGSNAGATEMAVRSQLRKLRRHWEGGRT
jgi:predicted ATP-grasp superfamily ATP-dependent carboligase